MVMNPLVEWIRKKTKHLKQTKSKWNVSCSSWKFSRTSTKTSQNPIVFIETVLFLLGTLRGTLGFEAVRFPAWFQSTNWFMIAPKKIPIWRRLATNWFMAAFWLESFMAKLRFPCDMQYIDVYCGVFLGWFGSYKFSVTSLMGSVLKSKPSIFWISLGVTDLGAKTLAGKQQDHQAVHRWIQNKSPRIPQ